MVSKLYPRLHHAPPRRGLRVRVTRKSSLITAAALPQRLHLLHELAIDLWWSWDDRARMVFRQLDYTLWRATAHNPVKMRWTMPVARPRAARH